MAQKILFICGSLNQTMMMCEIADHLQEYDCYFTPFYCDGFLKSLEWTGALNRTIAGNGSFRAATLDYLNKKGVEIDFGGNSHDYDLVVICTDMVVPKNIRNKKVVLVQEGMTDPENWVYHLVRALKLPGWLSGTTAATGLSDVYQAFCVASDGYRDLFVKRGAKPGKIRVTGIPNFDNAQRYCQNDFPHRGFVLVATSDMRETLKFENRRKTIEDAARIAKGRQLIFKLHPNEIYDRAKKEIETFAPGALVYQSGNIHEMIANCDVLITKFSTVVYTGLALGKEVYSEFALEDLKRLTPIQNGGTSGRNIASVCKEHLQ